jgi:thymidylate synthase
MDSLTKKYARDLYVPELHLLDTYGKPVGTRGRETLEILDFVSVIEEPHPCILIPSRKWNPWLAMSEALWILAGRNDTKALLPYNSHITDYSDDGETMYGAYGERIFDQIDDLIERLRKDPNDRRAVLQIWEYNHSVEETKDGLHSFYETSDLTYETKDPPCNNMVYFKLREGKLHMTVMCRSNDIHFGLFAVNIPTFSILQQYIASRLGVETGNQTHLSNSLHVYTDDKRAVEITDRMLHTDRGADMPAYPAHTQVFYPSELKNINSHESFAEMCSAVLDGESSPRSLPVFLAYAVRYLKAYKNRELPEVDSFPEFADWTLAAKMFAANVWTKF